MLLGEPKSVASAILAKFKGDEEPKPQSNPEQTKEEPDLKGEGHLAACEDMMQAIKSNSPHEFASALRAFLDQYEATDAQDEG